MSIRASGAPAKTPAPAAKPAAGQQTTPTPSKDGQIVPHEKIAMLAYDKWCRRGCPQGTDQHDWLEAEAEIKAQIAKSGRHSR